MLTAQQCLAHFGDPLKNEIKFMMRWTVPPELNIEHLPKVIYCNKLLVGPLEAALRALVQTGEIKYLKTWDGCFNIRKKRGATSASLHSWGVAIDLNAAWNPFGGASNMRPQFIKCFTDNGFDWGGNWKTKPDPMHLQLKNLEKATS